MFVSFYSIILLFDEKKGAQLSDEYLKDRLLRRMEIG